jgi:hypothetical protein
MPLSKIVLNFMLGNFSLFERKKVFYFLKFEHILNFKCSISQVIHVK